jgi:hypothetical protein
MTTVTRLLAAGLVLVAACSTDAREETPADDAPLADVGIDADPEQSAGSPGRVRLVNLWADDGKPGTVDLYVSRRAGKPVPLFTGVQFGAVTEPASVEADATVYAYRSGGPTAGQGPGSPDFIGFESIGTELANGHPLTLVVSYRKPLSGDGPSGAITIFKDDGAEVVGSMPAKPVGGTLLVTDVSAANTVSAGRETYYFGVPGHGCLTPAGATASGVSLGGTATATYDVPPGTTKIAAFAGSDAQCRGAATLAPVDVETVAGRRHYLFAYGTGSGDLRLLSVPGLVSP